MLEYAIGRIKKFARVVDMRIERAKYGYIEKLPEEIKYFEGGLYDAVYEASCKWPHNVALRYFSIEITYKELIKKIDHVARSLKAIGVERGERVTVCMPNTPEAVCMFYAINQIGAVANMIHPLSSEKEIEEYLRRAQSKVMLCIDIAYPRVEAIIKNTPLERVVVVSATRSMDLLWRVAYRLTKGRKNRIKRSQSITTWDRFLSAGSKFVGNPHARVNSSDPAAILYSGGTTGKPKGVILTNLNFNSQALGAHYLVPELLKSRYSMLTFLPNFHAFGLSVCVHLPLYSGMCVTLIPQFNPKKIRQYINRYKINIFVAVPTVYDYMLNLKFKKRELRRIKGAVSGGDVVSVALKENFNALLAAHGSKGVLHNGYGLTEACGGAVFPPVSIARDPDIVGYPVPDTEIKILDPETGQPKLCGEHGEIALRGLTIMQGYLDDPAETAATFITIDGKQYLKTGDIGYLDERGALHFKGRLKRMIITNGYNVYPSNIEDVTMRCAKIARCACIGIPDKLRGEVIKVFILPKKDASERSIRKELARIYRQYLAKYEIPRLIEFVSEIPKTKLGKVDYNALKKT